MTNKDITELINSFDKYVKAINASFDAVREALTSEDWTVASGLMTKISTAQARMSVNVKSACVKLEKNT